MLCILHSTTTDSKLMSFMISTNTWHEVMVGIKIDFLPAVTFKLKSLLTRDLKNISFDHNSSSLYSNETVKIIILV